VFSACQTFPGGNLSAGPHEMIKNSSIIAAKTDEQTKKQPETEVPGCLEVNRYRRKFYSPRSFRR
jgi:hypothetical protein